MERGYCGRLVCGSEVNVKDLQDGHEDGEPYFLRTD
jgi:hypothetical protein